MLIILEGPDGAGKTTLANDIAVYLATLPHYNGSAIDILHRGPATQHPLDEYELPLIGYRPGTGHLVCDRWHLGEAVYPRILNRTTRWDVAVARHINLFLKSRGACVVGMLATTDELVTRLITRGDDLIQPAQLTDIAYAYRLLRDEYQVANVAEPRNVITPRRVVGYAYLHQRACQVLNKFETYIGSPHPRRLLLGEIRAKLPPTKRGMPAFAPYPATSGHYLLTHLNTGQHDVGLANACDVDNPLLLWKTLNRPPVVALGRRAHAQLRDLEVPHAVVPHPQYIRRFHHSGGAAYADLIMTVKDGEDMTSWRP